MWDDERDARLRREAMAWLAIRSNDGADPVPSAALREFSFDGEQMPLLDAQRGIRKPAVLDAALSIRTVYTPEGRQRPYEDAPGPDGPDVLGKVLQPVGTDAVQIGVDQGSGRLQGV